MIINIEDKKWDVSISSGILRDMQDEGYDELTLSNIDSDDFQLFNDINEPLGLSIDNIVKIFKIAHYLNIEEKMLLFGRAIAEYLRRAQTYDEIKYILKLF